jgi:hypothetical protein
MKINLKFLLLFVLNFLITQNIFALKISEIYFHPDTSIKGEWIEIYNDENKDVDLSGYSLYEGDVGNETERKLKNTFIIKSGEYAIIARDLIQFATDNNYNFNILTTTSTFSLVDAGENLILKNSSKSVVDSVNYKEILKNLKEVQGQSLQIKDGIWGISSKTLGKENILQVNNNTNNATSTTTTTTINIAANTTATTSTTTNTTTNSINNSANVFTPIYSLPRDVIDPPKVYAYAGQTKIVLKNVETEFSGKIFDENKKEFRSGDFYWSFGDGTFSREKNVRKVFKKEGEYTVILEVRWNDIVDTDKIYIKVINPEVNIKINTSPQSRPQGSGPNLGEGGKVVEIFNNSNDEIDLGNFILKREDNMMKTFVLPKNFSILPSRSINLESSVTNFGEDIQRVGIYYPSNVLLKMYPETISNKTESIFVKNNISTTSSVTAYTLKDFQILQKDSLLQGVATGSGAKLASPISLPKFKKKTIYKNNFTQKVATNTNQAMISISASTDSNVVANNKIILEKPKSFFQNFKESLGF